MIMECALSLTVGSRGVTVTVKYSHSQVIHKLQQTQIYVTYAFTNTHLPVEIRILFNKSNQSNQIKWFLFTYGQKLAENQFSLTHACTKKIMEKN